MRDQTKSKLERPLGKHESAPPASSLSASTEPEAVSRRVALKAGAAGLAWLLTLPHSTPALAAELSHLGADGPMTGQRLAGMLRDERARWNALLAQVGADRMEVSGVEGTWSVKQIVAHLTWYERAVVEGAQQVLTTRTFAGPARGAQSLDERNVEIAAESHSRPVAEVLAEADEVFRQLLAVIEACPTELLNDPHRLGLPDDVVPWMLVANNSYGHYRQHEEAIRAWVALNPR